jgi:hypothetical protein
LDRLFSPCKVNLIRLSRMIKERIDFALSYKFAGKI